MAKKRRKPAPIEHDPCMCMKCYGSGLEFVNIGADHRQQFPCHVCGGSGKLADAVTRALVNGQTPPPQATGRGKELLAKFTGHDVAQDCP